MDPADLSIAGAGAALRAGRLTSVALTEAALARIEARNPAIRAFVAVTPNEALGAAAEADRRLAIGQDLGPLHGIPFAIKDIVDMAGVPTGCGSQAAGRAAADRDAAVTARFRAAGAVPLGKLDTYEFALVGPASDGPHPAARNPWDAGRITGGSSSGSASAIASGMVRIAIGTDTGGSVRSPAAYCGVVGLKPTHEAIPRDGVFPLSPSLDHVGLLGATVDDVAAAFSAVTGTSARVPETRLDGMTVGFARDWVTGDQAAAPEIVEALDAAVSDLSLLGARIRLVDLPDYPLMEAAGAVIIHAEALAVHRESLAPRWSDYGRLARQRLAAGLLLGPEDLDRAVRIARELRAAVDRTLEPLDALVTATTLTPAPPVPEAPIERAAWTPMRTLPFNVTGHPAMSVPCGFAHGLPVGMQIVGRHGDEATLLRIGAAFEAATDHTAQRPPIR